MEHLVATGGADRKVNLWDVGKGKLTARLGISARNAERNCIG